MAQCSASMAPTSTEASQSTCWRRSTSSISTRGLPPPAAQRWLQRARPASPTTLLPANIYHRHSYGHFWLEPTAGIRYVSSDFGSRAPSLGVADGEALRLQAGVRIGSDWVGRERRLWTVSFLAAAYSDVVVSGFAGSNSHGSLGGRRGQSARPRSIEGQGNDGARPIVLRPGRSQRRRGLFRRRRQDRAAVRLVVRFRAMTPAG